MGGRAHPHRAHVHHKRHHHAGHAHAHHTKMIMHHAKANGHGISLGQASHMAKAMREQGGGLHAAGRGVRRGRMKGAGFWSDFGDGFKKGFSGTLGIGAPLIGAFHPGAGAALGGIGNLVGSL